MNKLFGIVLVLFTVPVFAADLNYNYVQFGYQRIDVDGASEDADGFVISGSFEIGENWFVSGGYAQAEWDELGINTELDTITLGVGYHVAIADNMDFYGSLSAVRADASIEGFGSADDDGFGATIGLRSMVSDNIELTGSIGYTDLSDLGDSTALGAGLVYYISDNLGVGVFVEFDDDATGYGGGFRLYW